MSLVPSGTKWRRFLPVAAGAADPKPHRDPRLDALRGLAILSVLVLHSASRAWLMETWAVFHIWQAVPVFLVLMGVNASPSVARRIRRLLPAWAIVCLGAWMIAIATGGARVRTWQLLAGIPATGGPGGYFVAIAFQSALVVPLMYWARARSSTRVFLLGAAAVSLTIELLGPHLSAELYAICFLRYVFAVAIGMVASPPLLVGFSIVYLITYQLGLRIPVFRLEWQPQNLLAFAYAGWLTRVGLARLPSPRWLQVLGRASWSIFLVQTVYFATVPASIPAIANILVPVSLGLLVDRLSSALIARR